MTPTDVFLGLRFFREGRMQSVLIVAGVSVGVAVMVFLTILITGLQERLLQQTLGTTAHVVVRVPDEAARPLRTAGDGETLAREIVRPASRARSIVDWPAVVRRIEALPGVTVVSPVVSGAALASRGEASRTVALLGVEPERFAQVFALPEHIRLGAYRPRSTELVLGTELADDLGVGPGDRIRLSTGAGHAETFRVAGVFDLGNRDVNRRWVIVSMRAAQTLLDLVGGVTTLDVRLEDAFAADDAAAAIGGRTGLVAESWMTTNAQLLVALRSQSSSSDMIQFFVVLAVAMGIASVLIVSVVQKSREIGILRAMGMSRSRVQRIFLVQGLLVGVLGSLIGGAAGAGLAIFFASVARNADGSPIFVLSLAPAYFLRAGAVASVVGLLAAILPARRAAHLDPAEAIRHG